MNQITAESPAQEAPKVPEAERLMIDEQRAWLRDQHGVIGSWAQIAKRLNMPQGTLTPFVTGKYNGGPYTGGNLGIAEKISRYRQTQAAQAQIEVEAPNRPSYFQTETSLDLEGLLKWSQRGRLTVAALGPGLGKTSTAANFRDTYSNVFLATMSPSTSGVNTMQIAVLKKMGEKGAKGTPQKLSERIIEMVENLANPLIIIDEAQHLSQKSIEEIRSWHDACGVGIAFLGNIGIMQRLEGGSRSDAFAQLYSRVSLKMLRNLPLAGDVSALAKAWELHEQAAIDYLAKRICMTPGGLRNGTHALELGHMIAASRQQVLGLDHLQEAWAQLSTRALA